MPAPAYCHSKPRSEWCDRYGPGDFMGHTCAPPLDEILRALPALTAADLEKLHRALVRKRAAPFARKRAVPFERWIRR
jgi:hypothetical protein